MALRPKVHNRINRPRKSFTVHPSVGRFFLLALKLSIATVLVVAVVYGGWRYIFKVISESYRPNSDLFSECSQRFITIKSTPAYGVVFKTKGTLVTDVYLTAPSSLNEVKAIHLGQNDWLGVYFSNNFSMTQVGEFLRLSRLETGEYNYCYILEQLALTSGVPVEYVLVEDSEQGLSSTLTIAEARAILLSIELSGASEFNRNLLPLRSLDDGTKVTAVTYDSFKEQFENFFELEGVSQEQAFVEVYNSTDIDGYASILSRRWSMLGIDVSRVGNATHEEVANVYAILYVRDEARYSRTLAMIKSSFPAGGVELRSGRPVNVMATGDIVVFLMKR